MAHPAPERRVRVLLVEDDEDDYLITCDLLAAHPRARFEVDWCSSYEAALAVIAEARHEVYLVDYRLGARTGIELVREAFGDAPHAPVLMLTGLSAYEIDVEATQAGVTDFLVKQELEPLGLERSIRYAISHQRALEELRLSQERYALAVRAANDGIWDWDLVTERIYVSPRWNHVLGRPEQATVQRSDFMTSLVHPDDRDALLAALEAHLEGRDDVFRAEYRMRHADGTWRWTLVRGLAMGPPGARTRVCGSLADITDRRTAEQRLQYDVLHDALTGLPNRALFVDRVEQEMRRADRDPGSGCAVLFIDVDRFKLVNDGLGHAAGDQLLIELARRVTSVLRSRDTLARLGGDELVVLLEGVVEDGQAGEIARRILGSLAGPFRLEGRELFVTASLGVCLARGERTADELLRNADIAMYDGKRQGGGRVVFFDEGMHRQRVGRLARETELRHAIEHGLLEVAMQPIIHLATGEICGLEALCRWPSGWDPVAPIEFVAVAEETGLIGALGLQMLRRSLEQLAELRRDGLVADDVPVSVNVSARQLADDTFADQVRSTLADVGLPPCALTLEVTESTLMHEPARLAEMVAGLCAEGVGLHLDDFGTGYSSLAALQALPVDTLKIDRGFVASMEVSDVIVRSTVTLAHSLGMRVIAEGIETSEQLERLRELGCEGGQGYGLSRPLDPATLRSRLAEWTGQVPASTMPAPTVSFEASSTRMNEPVARLTA